MTTIAVRALELTDWQQYKAVRLTALKESPEAFVATFDEEAELSDDVWQERMTRSQRLLAEVDGEPVGVASVGQDQAEADPQVAELFALWVTPARRGEGVAAALVQAGAETAQQQGKTRLAYWVGSDNGRAVAFAVGFGFRPSDLRRPMRKPDGDSDDEVMLVMPLGLNRGEPTSR